LVPKFFLLFENELEHAARTTKKPSSATEEQGALQQMVCPPQSPMFRITELGWDYMAALKAYGDHTNTALI